MISDLHCNGDSDVNLNKVNVEETEDRRIGSVVLLVGEMLIFNG